MKHHLSLLLIVLLFLPSLACGAMTTSYVEGSGEIVDQSFDVSRFDRVALEGFGSVFITQGQTESLSVHTDENIIPFLDVQVNGGTLRLGIQRGVDVHPTKSITFSVTVKDLSAVRVDGSGDIYVEPIQSDGFDVSLLGSGNIGLKGLTAEDLSIALNGSGNIDIEAIEVQKLTTSLQGSGDIQLAGIATTQNLRVNGSGNYLAGDLETRAADINIPGSAEVTVWASEALTVRINGSGDIQYYGRPQIEQSGAGSGNLISLGEK